MNSPLTRYEHSTIAPYVQRQQSRPRRTLSHLAFSCIVGSIGVGLWVVGWQAFNSSSLGFVGLVIIGLAAIFSRRDSGGLPVVQQAQPQTAPPVIAPASLVRAWRMMEQTERLRLWPRLTDAQKGVLIEDAETRQKVQR